jgi:hypothetical protein
MNSQTKPTPTTISLVLNLRRSLLKLSDEVRAGDTVTDLKMYNDIKLMVIILDEMLLQANLHSYHW